MTWTALGPYGGFIDAIAIDPSDASTLYVGAQGVAIFKSTDAGASWAMTNRGIFYPPVYTLVMHPTDAHILYCGNSGSIFKTTDGGDSWVPADRGMPRGFVTIYSLVMDASNPDTLYAGSDRGIWKTTDGAANWSMQGLSQNTVYALALPSTDPGTIYAGTGQNGVFMSSDGGSTWQTVTQGLPNNVLV